VDLQGVWVCGQVGLESVGGPGYPLLPTSQGAGRAHGRKGGGAERPHMSHTPHPHPCAEQDIEQPEPAWQSQPTRTAAALVGWHPTPTPLR